VCCKTAKGKRGEPEAIAKLRRNSENSEEIDTGARTSIGEKKSLIYVMGPGGEEKKESRTLKNQNQQPTPTPNTTPPPRYEERGLGGKEKTGQGD